MTGDNRKVVQNVERRGAIRAMKVEDFSPLGERPDGAAIRAKVDAA
jgi:hypothetical protein